MLSDLWVLILFVIYMIECSQMVHDIPKLNMEGPDPLKTVEDILYHFMYGSIDTTLSTPSHEGLKYHKNVIVPHYPSGKLLRSAQMFQNKSAVHLPAANLIHRNHCILNLTEDYMQTAVDAFAIIHEGSVRDVMMLPRNYVLRSARTISMMMLEREKLGAMWDVVRGSDDYKTVTIETLEKFRPLFKYVPGKQIAQLNLTDKRIVIFIGTHADLNRHQVGVVASKYIKLNKRWPEPKYLNIMNNLLCGVPMSQIRKIPQNIYLQLAQQVFYHIRACDPIQRRFYLNMMMKSQALGRPYGWTARDVSRLGLLMAEVDGSSLTLINPKAMTGLTAQVVVEMQSYNLKYLTEAQLKYVKQKPRNIIAKKLKEYSDSSRCGNVQSHLFFIILNVLVKQLA